MIGTRCSVCNNTLALGTNTGHSAQVRNFATRLDRQRYMTRRLLLGAAFSAALLVSVSCGDSTRSAASKTTGQGVTTTSAVSPGCSDFQPRYIGSGLTVSLPPAATPTTAGGTADPGPVHAGAGVEFNANGVLVSVGRNLGHDASPEANFAKRVDGDIVVWIKASDAALRQCLLATTMYSAALDQKDES